MVFTYTETLLDGTLSFVNDISQWAVSLQTARPFKTENIPAILDLKIWNRLKFISTANWCNLKEIIYYCGLAKKLS